MNRRRFLFSTAALGASIAVAGAAQAGNHSLVVYAPGYGALNLRAGPGTQYHVIAKMPNGTHVTKLKSYGHWVKVKLANGYVGWASAKYLVKPGADYGGGHGGYAVWAVVKSYNGCLRLRKGPGTKYGVIVEMYNGDKVKILGKSGKWRKVLHEKSGAVGWAHGAYLAQH